MGVETPDAALHDTPEDDAYDGRDDVWSAAHAGRRTPLALARLRLTRGWRLLLFAGLGIVVAVVLICSVPLYVTLVGNVQLQHVLTTATPTDANVEVEVFAIPTIGRGLDDIMSAIAADTESLKGFATRTGSYIELEQALPPVSVSPKTEKLPEHPLVEPLVFDYASALPHMKVLAGRLPQDAKDGIPEVMVSTKMGLHTGDLITIDYQAATISGDTLKLHPLVVRVVGVWFPKDLDDPYWNGRSYDSVPPPPPAVGPPGPTFYPLLFARGDFVTTFVPPQPPNPSKATGVQRFQIVLHYVYLTDPAAITTANGDRVGLAIADLRGAAQNILTMELRTVQPAAIITGVTVGTRLDKLVAMIQRQLQLLAQPLYIIVAQVVVLALLFVVAMAALLVEAQAGELATLKSRGADIVQILMPFVLQGGALAAIAAVAGPVLAAALSLAVVRMYVPGAGSLAPGYLAHTIAPQSVTRPALAGAALGVLALVVAAWQAARLDVLAFRREQGRATHVALWRRYYLDLILAAVCMLGYLELGQFGGLDVRAQLGQQAPSAGADPFLLAAPALLLVAGALLVLRLFPLAARLGAALLGRGRGASGVLAFAQAARGGAQFTRLALLLTLAIGMALFALTFQASLGENATQKAAFVVGGDERDTLVQPLTIQTITLLRQMRALPGVTAAMPAYRGTASVNPAAGTVSAGVLGVDPANFARVAYWRADYAEQPLVALMDQLRAHPQGPDAGDRDHPLWALVDRTFAADNFVAPGAIFTLNPAEASDTTTRVYFRVEAVVSYIPTMTDPTTAGNILVDQHDYVTALLNPNLVNSQIAGPNEFWLRTTGTPGDNARRAHTIQSTLLPIASVQDRRALADALRTEPLNAGMSGLLLVGALTAALLAVLGSLVQAAVTARQRVTQFAILRTLGADGGQLLGILLSQQVIVFACGLVGGTLLGLVLATATLPFLQFSTQVANAAVLRMPPYTLVLNPAPIAAFYGVLALACLLALAISTRIATRTGLGRALRIGED